MQRQRTAAEIRADAIKMAIKKGTEGCESCARSYFHLAQQHGATEEEIERAIAAADTGAMGISRRDLLKLAALGAARIVAVSAVGGLAPQLMARTAAAAAQTTDGAQVAWVVATPSGQQLVGVAPDGSTVGQIDATNKAILRSPNGAIFYAVSSRPNGDTSTAIIEVYSAATGSLQQTITGRTLPLGNARGFDALDAMVSPDGRSLALLHQTSYVVTPAVHQVAKRDRKGVTRTISIDATTIINAVEVIDLTGAQSLDYFKLDDAPDNLLGGQVIFGPNNSYPFYSACYCDPADGQPCVVSDNATNWPFDVIWANEPSTMCGGCSISPAWAPYICTSSTAATVVLWQYAITNNPGQGGCQDCQSGFPPIDLDKTNPTYDSSDPETNYMLYIP